MKEVSSYVLYIGIPVLFVLIIFYLFRPGARRKYRRDAQIPFKEDKEQRD